MKKFVFIDEDSKIDPRFPVEQYHLEPGEYLMYGYGDDGSDLGLDKISALNHPHWEFTLEESCILTVQPTNYGVYRIIRKGNLPKFLGFNDNLTPKFEQIDTVPWEKFEWLRNPVHFGDDLPVKVVRRSEFFLRTATDKPRRVKWHKPFKISEKDKYMSFILKSYWGEIRGLGTQSFPDWMWKGKKRTGIRNNSRGYECDIF